MEALNKTKKVMFITVGTGRDRKDIASAIVKSIEIHNPTEVVFFCTEKSEKETIPVIRSILGERNLKVEFKIELIKDENDFESIKDKCAQVIKSYSGIKEVDYTSGTKAMSVGLVLAALEEKVDSIIYISGRRDSEGRVIPGSERINSYSPIKTYIDELYKKAIEYFNIKKFEIAKHILKDCKRLYQERDFVSEVENLIYLCEVYSYWELADYNRAFEVIRNLNFELLRALGLKSRMEKHRDLIFKMKSSNFCEERVVDLYKNAERRIEESRYDDAVARLYRLLEYILQFIANRRQLYIFEGREYKVDIAKLPKELIEKYEKVLEQLGLMKLAELLNDIGDENGKLIYKKIIEQNLKEILHARNNSILAHGFSPISEDKAKCFLREMENIIKRFIGEEKFKDLYNSLEFPKIKQG